MPGAADVQNERCWERALANQDLQTARAACDASLRIDPNSPDVLDSRGMVGLRQQRWQDAWNDYNAALSGEPFASALYGRGVSAMRLGRASAGRADLARAAQLDPAIAQTFVGYGITP